MKREDIIQEFKQNEGAFKFVVIELVNGENVKVNVDETIHFSYSSLTIYYPCCSIKIYYDNIKGLEVIKNYNYSNK